MITAALDIGSNSIHLVVVETDHEKPFRVVASAKEVVRLGRSSARDQRLSAAAMDRAVDCLKRFRRVAESHGARELIVVATSAVREAANGDQFITRAAEEAGVEIDLLSGIEEARLIALAVSVRYKQSNKQQALIIDIGGAGIEACYGTSGTINALAALSLRRRLAAGGGRMARRRLEHSLTIDEL